MNYGIKFYDKITTEYSCKELAKFILYLGINTVLSIA